MAPIAIKPKVSILIPVYNGSNFLKQAIDSAIGQYYTEKEIIVINDGSNDNGATRKVAESFVPNIMYYEKENGGVASALNLGIEKSTGEYISWLSHDDFYYPNKLEDQISYVTSLENNKVIVFSNEDMVDENNIVIRPAFQRKFDNSKFYRELLVKKFIGGCSLLIPRKAFDRCGEFDESLRTVQDYDMWFRMLNNGYTFSYYQITSGAKRRHGGQDSQQKKELRRKEKIVLLTRALTSMTDEILKKNFPKGSGDFFTIARSFYKQGLSEVYLYCFERGLRIRTGFGQRLLTTPSCIYTKFYPFFYEKRKAMKEKIKIFLKSVSKKR